MLPASVEPSSRILKPSPVKVALVSAPVDATDVVYAVAVGPKVATTAPAPAFVPVCAMPTAMPACAVVSVPLALEDCVTATAAWGGKKQCPPDRNSARALFGIAVVTEPAIREPQFVENGLMEARGDVYVVIGGDIGRNISPVRDG